MANFIGVTLQPGNGIAFTNSGTTVVISATGGLGGDADGLNTTAAPVAVNGAAPPTAGQVLTASSPTAASWQTPAAGGVSSLNLETGAISIQTTNTNVNFTASGQTITQNWAGDAKQNLLVGSSGSGITGQANSAFGNNACSSNRSENYNTAFGAGACRSNGSASYPVLTTVTTTFTPPTGGGTFSIVVASTSGIAVGNVLYFGNAFQYVVVTKITDSTHLTVFQPMEANATVLAGSNVTLLGDYNSAIGAYSMQLITTAMGNTGVGYNSLGFLGIGNHNTAVGCQALTGINVNESYSEYTCVGAYVGYKTRTQLDAFGYCSLHNCTQGSGNAAFGHNSLFTLTTGNNSSAFGNGSLYSSINSTNDAFGYNALYHNNGNFSCGFGCEALYTATGGANSAFGYQALYSLNSGTGNIAIGNAPGSSYVNAESDNILIGNAGVAAESNTTRIGTSQTAAYVAGIYGKTVGVTNGLVMCDNNNLLGTLSLGNAPAAGQVLTATSGSAASWQTPSITPSLTHKSTVTISYGGTLVNTYGGAWAHTTTTNASLLVMGNLTIVSVGYFAMNYTTSDSTQVGFQISGGIFPLATPPNPATYSGSGSDFVWSSQVSYIDTSVSPQKQSVASLILGMQTNASNAFGVPTGGVYVAFPQQVAGGSAYGYAVPAFTFSFMTD